MFVGVDVFVALVFVRIALALMQVLGKRVLRCQYEHRTKEVPCFVLIVVGRGVH